MLILGVEVEVRDLEEPGGGFNGSRVSLSLSTSLGHYAGGLGRHHVLCDGRSFLLQLHLLHSPHHRECLLDPVGRGDAGDTSRDSQEKGKFALSEILSSHYKSHREGVCRGGKDPL